jgi:hypothetical protein
MTVAKRIRLEAAERRQSLAPGNARGWPCGGHEHRQVRKSPRPLSPLRGSTNTRLSPITAPTISEVSLHKLVPVRIPSCVGRRDRSGSHPEARSMLHRQRAIVRPERIVR